MDYLGETPLELSFYSLIGSTGFYAGFIYFQGQADRIRDSIRGQVPYLALWDINNFAAQDSFAIAYQWNVIQNNEARAVRQLQNANISARLGALGLVAAGIFLYLQLDVDADKEAGEFSVFYQNARVQLYSGCARTGRFDCFEQPDDSGDRGYNALGISLTF